MSLLTKFAAARKLQKLASAARLIRKRRVMNKVAVTLTGYEDPRVGSTYQPSYEDLAIQDYARELEVANNAAKRYLAGIQNSSHQDKYAPDYYSHWVYKTTPHYDSYSGSFQTSPLRRAFNNALDAHFDNSVLGQMSKSVNWGPLDDHAARRMRRGYPIHVPQPRENLEVRLWDSHGPIPQVKNPVNPKLPLVLSRPTKMTPTEELDAWVAGQYREHSKQPTFLKLRGPNAPKAGGNLLPPE